MGRRGDQHEGDHRCNGRGGQTLKGTVQFDALGKLISWQGRMNELLDDLVAAKFGHSSATKSPGWPGSPQYLSLALRHAAGTLKEGLKVTVTWSPKGKRPTIELSK